LKVIGIYYLFDIKNSFLQQFLNFYSSSGNESEQKNNSGRKKVTQKIIWQKTGFQIVLPN
jgi:hypothetical protein